MMIFRLFIISLLCYPVVLAADEELPSDPRLLFNHGAELADSGQWEDAVAVLRQVAVVRDKMIAAKALTLLGQIAAASAKQSVSENPAETPPEQRQIILDHLQSAEQSFSESLLLLSNNEVRQNLETLRAWRNNMTHLWQEHDREQRRNAELQQRIRWLADWEKELTDKVLPITNEPDSPRKFQTGYETGREQRQLAEELSRLQDVPMSDEKLIEQWKHLPEIQKIAGEAAELLSQNQADKALPKQQQVLNFLQSLLKQDQNKDPQEQNQNKENQEQQNQQEEEKKEQEGEKKQEQEQKQPEESQKEEEQKQEMSPQQESVQKKEEEEKEKVDRLLTQVRRKEQAAKKRREKIRVLQMQVEPVEKDW